MVSWFRGFVGCGWDSETGSRNVSNQRYVFLSLEMVCSLTQRKRERQKRLTDRNASCGVWPPVVVLHARFYRPNGRVYMERKRAREQEMAALRTLKTKKTTRKMAH